MNYLAPKQKDRRTTKYRTSRDIQLVDAFNTLKMAVEWFRFNKNLKKTGLPLWYLEANEVIKRHEL